MPGRSGVAPKPDLRIHICWMRSFLGVLACACIQPDACGMCSCWSVVCGMRVRCRWYPWMQCIAKLRCRPAISSVVFFNYTPR